MNRAERRRSARQEQKKEKTYTLTQREIDQIKLDATNEAVHRAFLMFLSIPVMVLHDKFGFGKQRLSRLMDYALIWFDAVQKEEVRIMELVNIAKDECGIDTINWEASNDNLTSRSNRSIGKK